MARELARQNVSNAAGPATGRPSILIPKANGLSAEIARAPAECSSAFDSPAEYPSEQIQDMEFEQIPAILRYEDRIARPEIVRPGERLDASFGFRRRVSLDRDRVFAAIEPITKEIFAISLSRTA